MKNFTIYTISKIILIIIIIAVITVDYFVQNTNRSGVKASNATKTYPETVLNPFGDSWISKKGKNPYMTIAFGACFDRHNRIKDGQLNLSTGEVNIISKLNHPFIYFDQCPVIEDDSPKFRIISNKLKSINPDVKIIGYYIINFIERPFAAGVSRFKEEWYVHKKGTSKIKENRLKIGNDYSYFMDITNREYQLFIAGAIAGAMEKNLIDGVLIDGSGQTIPLAPSNGTKDEFPDNYTANYKSGMIATLGEIKKALTPKNKLVFFNPMTPEGPYWHDINLTKWMMEETDGAMWEEPFRHDWRDVEGQSADYYYNKIAEFTDLASSMNKYILVVQNTHLNQEPYSSWSRCADMHCAFRSTTYEKERKYERYYLAFYLNFFNGEKTPFFYYTPVQDWDIFSSETFFADWDVQIGNPKGKAQKITDHIYRRNFEKAQVWLNNSDKEYMVNLESYLYTLDGVKINRYSLPSKSGMIFAAQDAWPVYITITPVFSPVPIITPTAAVDPSVTKYIICPGKNQGDANCDGVIDGVDYSMWLNSQCHSMGNQTCADTKADFNIDGNVNDDDYRIWFRNRP